ncbi:MAG: amidohydrolase family protein [Pseudomonadota bacterium]
MNKFPEVSPWSESISRRTFLTALAAAPVLALTESAPGKVFATPRTGADLVLKDCHLVTMNEKIPSAQAMAVKGDTIVGLGSYEEIVNLIDRKTRVIDLKNDCISPGLIDAHSHLIAFGQMQLMFVILRPPEINSFDTLLKALAKAANDRPKNEWIVGRGFRDFKEGRFPTRRELDEAVTNNPVLIIHWSGQFGVANTSALKKADLLRADIKDPYGAAYLRGKDKLPNGILVHYPAIYSVYSPPMTDGQQLEAATWAMRLFAEQGVTCVHDNFIPAQKALKYLELEQRSELPIRVRVYPYIPNLERCQVLLSKVKRYQTSMLRLQGVKLAIDGYPLMYTALDKRRERLIKPMHPKDQFEAIVKAIHDAEFQVDVHAVGDKAVDLTLDGFLKACGSASECRRRRHRIEHFPFRKLDSIKRAADYGVPVCSQPEMITVRGDELLVKSDKKLVNSITPIATFIKEGVTISFGADVPAFPSYRPLDSIKTAMLRKTEKGKQLDQAERISFMAGLSCHTINAAYAGFDEKELGSLEVGKKADFVIWNQDLKKIESATDLAELKPKATFIGGKIVFESNPGFLLTRKN